MPRLSDLADVSASFDPQVGLHFELQCYVCGSTCTKPSKFEGWATFTQIFQQRPDGCRFAIARMVPIRRVTLSATRDVVEPGDAPVGDYLCWDLLHDDLAMGRTLRNRGLLPAPTPKWQSSSLDGLVMKAMALYDKP